MPPKVTTRKLKAGETLAGSGVKHQSMYLVQDGSIAYCLTKGTKLLEITHGRNPESIGDEAFFGPGASPLKTLAIRDTTVLELPFSLLREQFGNPVGAAELNELKLLLKTISDRSKTTYAELRTIKANAEVQACPPESTAKLFGTLFHVARILGRVDGISTVIEWGELRDYADEVFSEPSLRLESGLNILIKLGYAKINSGTVALTGMKELENFFEYFGNYFFKGTAAEFLKTNSKSTAVTRTFLEVTSGYPVDRGGNAQVPFKPVVDAMKAKLGPSFEADQLFRLEQKGLFLKRVATNDGGTLIFYRPDFEQMLLNWRILREVELWNEAGYVDMGDKSAQQVAANSAPAPALDPEAERKKWATRLAQWKPAAGLGQVPTLRTATRPRMGELWCPMCMSVVQAGQSECQVCGQGLPSF